MLLGGHELGAISRACYARQVVVIEFPGAPDPGHRRGKSAPRLGGDPDQGAPYLSMDAARAAFDRVELSDDMFQLGLRTVVDAESRQALVEAVLAAGRRCASACRIPSTPA